MNAQTDIRAAILLLTRAVEMLAEQSRAEDAGEITDLARTAREHAAYIESGES